MPASIRSTSTVANRQFRLHELAQQEARFAMVGRSDPENAERLAALAQKDIDDQWHYYEQMAGVERRDSMQWRGTESHARRPNNQLSWACR